MLFSSFGVLFKITDRQTEWRQVETQIQLKIENNFEFNAHFYFNGGKTFLNISPHFAYFAANEG